MLLILALLAAVVAGTSVSRYVFDHEDNISGSFTTLYFSHNGEGATAIMEKQGEVDSYIGYISLTAFNHTGGHVSARQIKYNVRALKSAAVPEGFDACRSAKKKTYRYCVYLSRREHPLMERYAVRSGERPDPARMKACAALLEGEHDFKAYCASRSQVKTTVRTVFSAYAEKRGEDVKITVCGGGFLYNMVRTMAGTMLGCASGALSRDDIINSLSTGSRNLVGKTMPARGLVLMDVDYGFDLFGEHL